MTADQILLDGPLTFDFPVINDLTFDHQILNLTDPTAGFNRDVLRITFGTRPVVPEPASLVLLLGACLTASALSRGRARY